MNGELSSGVLDGRPCNQERRALFMLSVGRVAYAVWCSQPPNIQEVVDEWSFVALTPSPTASGVLRAGSRRAVKTTGFDLQFNSARPDANDTAAIECEVLHLMYGLARRFGRHNPLAAYTSDGCRSFLVISAVDGLRDSESPIS